MIESLKVIASFEMDQQCIQHNGEVIDEISFTNASETLKERYKKYKLKYPKFHKMDLLSKAVILGNYFIKKAIPKNSTPLVMLFNESASMQSDLQHIYQYNAYDTASPGIFVYTLPNICIGEVCIKNDWKSPSGFLLFPKEHFEKYLETVAIEMSKNDSEYAFTGFVEVVEDDIFVALSVLQMNKENEGLTAYQFYKKALRK